MLTIHLPAGPLATGLEAVRHSMTRTTGPTPYDTPRRNLTGVHLSIVDGRALLETADGHRLARYKFPDPLPKAPDVNLILGRDLVKSLVEQARKAKGGTVPVQVPQTEPEHDKAGCIEGRFPTLDPVIPGDDGKTRRLTLPVDGLRAGLRMVAHLSPERIKPVKLGINGSVTLESEPAEYGRVEHDLPGCTWPGGDLSIGFNGPYLTDAVRGAGDTVTLAFGASALHAVRVEWPELSELVQVVMPLRIEW